MLKKDSYKCFSLQKTEKEQLKNTSSYCLMPSLSVLRCSGEKIRDYLQGQITQDIALLSPIQGIYTAILNHKGKCVSEAWLIESGENQIDMIFPSACSEELVQRLRMFSIGYKLRMGVLVDMKVMAITSPKTQQGALYSICPQYGGIHLPHAQFMIYHKDMQLPELPKITSDCMQAWEVYNAIPRFMLDWDQSTYPMNAGLIQRQGISFDKGCYVGQEVASRMHWRKLIKTSFYSVVLHNKSKVNTLTNQEQRQVGSFLRVVFDESESGYLALGLLSLKYHDLSDKIFENESRFG